MSAVLVVGEALVDVVSAAGYRRVYAGGSPLNVAFGLGRLGVPTQLLTAYGDDAYGSLLADHLSAAGVGVIRPGGGQRATSSAEAIIDADGAARYRFHIEWDLASQADVPEVRFIHTGSIAAAMAPGADAIVEMFASAPPGVLLSYDPNVRPDIIGEPEDVRSRILDLIGLSHVVKLSDEDAEWIFPGLTPMQVCDRILELGARLIAVTLGAGGCVLASAETRVRRSALPVEVIDTIGAGDAFMSALIYALRRRELEYGTPALSGLDDEALSALAEMAVVSAAITVSRAGAVPPRRAELEAMMHGR